jgi:hypothetical protein
MVVLDTSVLMAGVRREGCGLCVLQCDCSGHLFIIRRIRNVVVRWALGKGTAVCPEGHSFLQVVGRPKTRGQGLNLKPG